MFQSLLHPKIYLAHFIFLCSAQFVINLLSLSVNVNMLINKYLFTLIQCAPQKRQKNQQACFVFGVIYVIRCNIFPLNMIVMFSSLLEL